jgi:uncharacterized protein (TIGR02996 family)
MTEAGLLGALEEKPDDDTTRLGYADWLDEQDDSQSRVKVQLIRMECDPVKPRKKGERRVRERRREPGEQLPPCASAPG